jgi:hypothetical protein
MGGHSYSIDEELYISATKSFVNFDATVDLSDKTMASNLMLFKKEGTRGTHHTGFGTLLLFAPFAIVGEFISKAFSGSTRVEIFRLVFFSANSFYTALIATFLFRLSRMLGLSNRRAAAVALIYGLCTYQWQYASNGFPQTLSALTIFLTFYYFSRFVIQKNSLFVVISGMFLGLSAAVRITNLIFVPFFIVAVYFGASGTTSYKLRQLLKYALSGLPFIGLSGWFNWIKFGDPITSGYPKLNFNTPLYEGLYGLFLSSGKGLIFYAPIALLACFGLRISISKIPILNLLAISLILVQAVAYGRFEIWSGENSYGPRYLVPVLPLVCVLVIPLARIGKQWLVGMWVSGIVGFLFSGLMGKLMYFNAVYWNQQPGLLRDMDATALTAKQQYLAWNFQPRSSPLVLQLRALPELVANTFSRLSGGLGKLDQIPISYDDRIHWYARTINLDFWWAWWPAKSTNHFVYLFLIFPLALIYVGAREIYKQLRYEEPIETDAN